LDEPLSHEKGLRRYFRETFVASARRRFVAKRLALGAHHLTGPMADGPVFVERVDDRRVRQCISSLTYEIVAEKERVLEVDNIRLVGNKELSKILDVHVFIG
jgi:hypothetical protein